MLVYPKCVQYEQPSGCPYGCSNGSLARHVLCMLYGRYAHFVRSLFVSSFKTS